MAKTGDRFEMPDGSVYEVGSLERRERWWLDQPRAGTIRVDPARDASHLHESVQPAGHARRLCVHPGVSISGEPLAAAPSHR